MTSSAISVVDSVTASAKIVVETSSFHDQYDKDIIYDQSVNEGMVVKEGATIIHESDKIQQKKDEKRQRKEDAKEKLKRKIIKKVESGEALSMAEEKIGGDHPSVSERKGAGIYFP